MIRKYAEFGLAVFTLLIWAIQARGMTIYVDINNTAGPWDGLTPATAWTNITQGATHLAATNATVQGGHVVSVAAGTYYEEVDLTVY